MRDSITKLNGLLAKPSLIISDELSVKDELIDCLTFISYDVIDLF